MIYEALRRALFMAPPERIHRLVFGALRAATATGPARRGLSRGLAPHDQILASTVFGVRFPGPLGLAAGFDKDGLGLNTWGALGFGYAEIGTVTPRPQPGNPEPRLFRLPEDRALLLPLQLDVLINNAGIGESGSLAEIDLDRVRRVFEVNLFATLALTQVALKGMIARKRGTVLLVSSIAGRLPMPFLMPYGMTKFALSAAGAGLRAELDQLGKNVHVALIEPGAIHTGFNQAMTDSKYAWMTESSYFFGQAARMRRQERRTFAFLEARNTRSIVAQIVKAAEARRPRLRYVAPWVQGLLVRLARMLGV